MSRLATRVNKLYEQKKQAWWDAWEVFGRRWGQLMPVQAHNQLTPENEDGLIAFARECRKQSKAGETAWLSLWEGVAWEEYKEALDLIVVYQDDTLPFDDYQPPFPLMPEGLKTYPLPPEIPDGLEGLLLAVLSERTGKDATLAAVYLRNIALLKTVREYQG